MINELPIKELKVKELGSRYTKKVVSSVDKEINFYSNFIIVRSQYVHEFSDMNQEIEEGDEWKREVNNQPNEMVDNIEVFTKESITGVDRYTTDDIHQVIISSNRGGYSINLPIFFETQKEADELFYEVFNYWQYGY